MSDLLLISREAFTIFGMEIYWYGLIITSGMLGGFFLALYNGKKRGFTSDFVYELFIITIVFAIFGARLIYVLFNEGYFPINNWDDFKNLYNIRSGGLTIIGGVGIGFLGVLITARRNKVSIIHTTDLVVPSLLFGQIVGRWGNYVNQEAYGAVVENTALHKFPFAVFIERNASWHYATFFYESVLNFIALAFVLLLARYKKVKTGIATFFYLLWYGVVRAIMEITRMDAVIKDWGVFGEVNITQLFCILIAVGALVVIILIQTGRIKTSENVYLVVNKLSATTATDNTQETDNEKDKVEDDNINNKDK